MSYQRDSLRRQEEDCVYRYNRDMLCIEDDQDRVKRQRSLLNELDEDMFESARRMQERFDQLAYSTSDPRVHHLAIGKSNEVAFARIRATEDIDQYHEDLNREERKLADEYEKREQEYRKEIHGLYEKRRDE